ncbi:GumC family protein [Beggiatoa leptomitoformis]|uniref:non-specific protein-tyrosine kinase n=1 Tax=Beggiatoa leptomitoformis TaxID=288004 RepID=A0A2N9YI88_9GAMM|nr:polysaccharide biosynthesis tyrosine autokinase [Beggiatoa leptomitoformis]ALG67528.1 polysaccharide biosynthesis tyrosine autokinase [Beggiatoa leptomitoformis]AUI70248.1 polysaccharide biosynthesis tyrosine autokinase [Beggiatoa leptomitoformis]
MVLVNNTIRFMNFTQKQLTSSEFTNSVDENEVDLRVYLNIINRYKWRILRLTLLIGLLAWLISYTLQPIYTATTTFLINVESPNIVSVQEFSVRNDQMKTQIDILSSMQVWEETVARIQKQFPEKFQPQPRKIPSLFGMPLDWQTWLSDWGISTTPVPPTNALEPPRLPSKGYLVIQDTKGSQIVAIAYDSPDPELASAIPNTLAEVYVENDLESRLQMTQKATVWLTERLDGLRGKLEDSEKNLQGFTESQKLVDVAGVKSVASQELSQISLDLGSARRKLAETSNMYEQIQRAKGKPLDVLVTIPAVFADPLVGSLKSTEVGLEQKASELGKRYGSQHPEMIAVKTELETNRANLARAVQRIIDSVTKQYEVDRANVATLDRSMRQKEGEIQSINRKQYDLGVRQRDVEANRQLYDMFLARFKETGVTQTEQKTIGRIVDAAVTPTTAYKPKKLKLVAVAMIAGLLFSIFLAFLLEHLNNTLKHGDDVEQKLGMSLLGILPRLTNRKSKQRPLFVFVEEEHSYFAESIRSMRTGIMLSNVDNPHKTLLVTSSLPAEGKTTFATNQAFALGQLDKTVLIDADMRRPSVGKGFGLTDNAPGLSEMVAGTKPFTECIHRLEGVDIDLIPSGMLPPNPLELLSSQHFAEVLKELEKQYKYVVIDSAPIHAVSDALMIAKVASAVIYVTKADFTPYQLIRGDIRRLMLINKTPIGVVLNQVIPKELSRYYGTKYGYYGGYSDYYGTYGSSATKKIVAS